MITKILTLSRYLILLAVIGSYLASALLIIYNSLFLITIIIHTISHPNLNFETSRLLALDCIEVIDFFLLATACYIVSLGLYAIFIDNRINLPARLEVNTLTDLKARLLSVIIVVLSVYFLEQVITWDGKRDLLSLGIAIALLIGVITLTIRFQSYELRRQKNHDPSTDK